MTLIDRNERMQAIDPANSCIIQAPAGAGKTGLLVQRFLRLLTVVDRPEEIVAITFTRKAAAEMQGRVLEYLHAAANGEDSDDEHRRETLHYARRVLQRDCEKGWGLLDNPSRLRMQTIDSLCNWLAQQLPLLSGLGTLPTISDDVTTIYQQAAMRLFSILQEDNADADLLATLLLHMDNALVNLAQLLAGMLHRREQWLRHTVFSLRPEESKRREQLEHTLQHVVVTALGTLQQYMQQSLSAGQQQLLLASLRFAASYCIAQGEQSDICNCMEWQALPGSDAATLPQWSGLVSLLLTNSGDWRKRITKKQGFPATEKKMKEKFTSLLQELSADTRLLELLRTVRLLPDTAYTDEEWCIISALCRCLTLADAELRLCFSESHSIDHIGVASAAVSALGDDEEPTDLALYLDYRIQHILVDEFQDISILQYRLLELLCAGWGKEDGHSLFLVGDPMQSIYRFREAEVGFFLRTFARKRLAQVPLLPLRLQVNFRSAPALVQWNNECFAAVLPQQDDIAMSAVRFTPAQPGKSTEIMKDSTAIQIYPFTTSSSGMGEAEARQVIATIEQLQESRPDETIAVLVRNRKHLEQITPLLHEARLPFRAVDIDPLQEQTVIQDLTALTRACMHPADRIAWFAVLRAPWCGLQLEHLLHLAVQVRAGECLWQCVQDEERWQSIPPERYPSLRRFVAAMQAAITGSHTLGLAKRVERLWHRLGGDACVEDKAGLTNATRFFELLEQFDHGGVIAWEEFMQQLEKLYAEPDAAMAAEKLQLMTIHKAKGLEFDHVIIPMLGRTPKKNKRELLLWDTCLTEDTAEELIMAPIGAARSTADSKTYCYIQHLQQQRSLFEEQRLLYVACTRARHSLHILATIKTKKEGTDGEKMGTPVKNSLLYHLWPVLQPHFAKHAEEVETENIASRQHGTAFEYRRLHPDWQLPAMEPHLQWNWQQEEGETTTLRIDYDWARADIRHVGVVVHRLLQYYAEAGGLPTEQQLHTDTSRNMVENLLLTQGVSRKGLDAALTRTLQAIANTAKDQFGQWIFARQHQQVHNEYAISGVYQGRLCHVVIDRCFVADGIRWIVDYKTSDHKGTDIEVFLQQEKERYQPQLERYRTLLQGLSEQPVRAGLYFPLLQAWQPY